MPTDLHALVSERCAAKIQDGKRPSRADLEWLEATREASVPYSSVEITRNAKGEMQFSAKGYHVDLLQAESQVKEVVNRLRATYPMSDGTVGSPMKSDVQRAASAAAAIASNQAKAKAAKS